MSTGVLVLLGYFACGLVALGLFDIATGRLRSNWDKSIIETMTRLSAVGVPLSDRGCVILFAAVLWLFWPMVLYGALRDVVDEWRRAS